MYRVTTSVFLLAGEALAHPGHGAPTVHWHGWEYALFAVLIAGVAIYCAARK